MGATPTTRSLSLLLLQAKDSTVPTPPSDSLLPPPQSVPQVSLNASGAQAVPPLRVYHRRHLPGIPDFQPSPASTSGEPMISSSSISGTTDPFLVTTRSGRPARLPSRLQDYHLHLTAVDSSIRLPDSVDAALLHPSWRTAMHSELESIHKNGTWDMMPLPPHRTAISTKWVFGVKTNSDGTVDKLKARLVARGFQQREAAKD